MRTRYFPDDHSYDEFDLWLKHVGPPRLVKKLSAIRARIGAATERPGDIVSFKAIGCRIRNALSPPSKSRDFVGLR
jgi:hypothetical protein